MTNSDLDEVYDVHVRAPLTLMRELLPALHKVEGQVVFLNSNLGWRLDRADAVEHAAAKHAPGIANGMHALLNPAGARVVSLYLSRTNAPIQQQIHQKKNRPYHPERIIQPTDITKLATGLLTSPKTAEVRDVWMRPTLKYSPALGRINTPKWPGLLWSSTSDDATMPKTIRRPLIRSPHYVVASAATPFFSASGRDPCTEPFARQRTEVFRKM